MFLEKMPLGKNVPWKIDIPGKSPPGKLLLMKFFCEFFLISIFIFMRVFSIRKSTFSLFILYALFFPKHIFLISGMVYNVYHTYMRDQQCWASLPSYTGFFLSNAFFQLSLSLSVA